MQKLKCYFIINPISGFANQQRFPALLERYIDKQQFVYEFSFTKYKGHAIELTNEAVRQGFDYIVAVGGDGTINEVASQLVNQPAKLGIVPQGSGNGFARHLGISLSPRRAIMQLNCAKTIQMDTGIINGKYFFNVSGTGFDGHISRIFALQQRRGFANYIRIVLKEFQKFQAMPYRYQVNGKWVNGQYFLIAIANTSQYGNNAVIAPKARPDDGLLDVVLMQKIPTWLLPSISLKAMLGQLDTSRYIHSFRTNHLVIECPENAPVHIDGEYYKTGKVLDIKVLPQSLQTLAPA